jgi:hypothetical protein
MRTHARGLAALAVAATAALTGCSAEPTPEARAEAAPTTTAPDGAQRYTTADALVADLAELDPDAVCQPETRTGLVPGITASADCIVLGKDVQVALFETADDRYGFIGDMIESFGADDDFMPIPYCYAVGRGKTGTWSVEGGWGHTMTTEDFESCGRIAETLGAELLSRED